MTCIQAQSLITPFINNKIPVPELEEFLEHVEACPNCKEELEVYYALLTAMKQLNEDKNLSGNYTQELTEKLEKAREHVIHARFTYCRKIAMLILTMILLVFLFSFSYANRSALQENAVKYSNFRLRTEFHEEREDMLRQRLELYLSEQYRLEQNILLEQGKEVPDH